MPLTTLRHHLCPILWVGCSLVLTLLPYITISILGTHATSSLQDNTSVTVLRTLYTMLLLPLMLVGLGQLFAKTNAKKDSSCSYWLIFGNIGLSTALHCQYYVQLGPTRKELDSTLLLLTVVECTVGLILAMLCVSLLLAQKTLKKMASITRCAQESIGTEPLLDAKSLWL